MRMTGTNGFRAQPGMFAIAIWDAAPDAFNLSDGSGSSRFILRAGSASGRNQGCSSPGGGRDLTTALFIISLRNVPAPHNLSKHQRLLPGHLLT